MKVLGVIPARYESTRFPGKPLVKIGSKSMIHRVYDQAVKVLCDVVVATDDDRIRLEVESFYGRSVMTSQSHRSGTDRCLEAMQIYEHNTGRSVDAIINIQGDEPFVSPKLIAEINDQISTLKFPIITVIKKIEDPADLFNPSVVKIVKDNFNRAIYFSRNPIPFNRDHDLKDWFLHHNYYKHLGIYAYTSETLKKITALEPGLLEKSESLEQLRWIENGFPIYCVETEFDSISIDTPSDLDEVLKKITNLD